MLVLPIEREYKEGMNDVIVGMDRKRDLRRCEMSFDVKMLVKHVTEADNKIKNITCFL